MSNNKKKVTMEFDSDIWEIAKVVLPCTRTKFLEQQLINYIKSVDEIEILEKEVYEMEQEILAKKEKIKILKDNREKRSKNRENVDKALDTVKNIFHANGIVTLNQINHIANREQISKDILIKEAEKNKYKVLKIYEK